MRLAGSARVRAMWLAASVAVTLAPHVNTLPTWLSGFAALMLLWLCWIVLHGLRLPPRWLMLVVVGGAVAGVLLTFHSPFGKDPGVALLTAFLALKLLETRAPRDGYVVVLLCYFMQLAQFFANQSIATAGLTLLGTCLLYTSPSPRDGLLSRMPSSA